MSENQELMAFNVKVLLWLNLWSSKETHGFLVMCKNYSFLFPVVPAMLHVIIDFFAQLNGMFEDIAGITENLIAIIAFTGVVYITTCFANNREKIRILIFKMHDFRKISDQAEVLETENKVRLYSKMFLAYGIIGTLVYAFSPLFQIEQCRIKRITSKHSKDIPCGMVTRGVVPKFLNNFPYLVIMYLNQLYTCVVVSLITLAITALLCGLLMHTVTQIRFLKKKILNSCIKGKSDEEIEKDIHFCVKYHQLIIEYANYLDKAFNTMMLMHLSITSLTISVLGFEIIMVNSLSDSVRFGFHLGGWIILLYLTCHYGQVLIDESKDIGETAYNTRWYITNPRIQKDISLIILRAQRPLTLSANSLGIMSLEIFLKVMSSAYSYFTLLLKVKN